MVSVKVAMTRILKLINNGNTKVKRRKYVEEIFKNVMEYKTLGTVVITDESQGVLFKHRRISKVIN